MIRISVSTIDLAFGGHYRAWVTLERIDADSVTVCWQASIPRRPDNQGLPEMDVSAIVTDALAGMPPIRLPVRP